MDVGALSYINATQATQSLNKTATYNQVAATSPGRAEDKITLSEAGRNREATLKELGEKYDPRNMDNEALMEFAKDAWEAGIIDEREFFRIHTDAVAIPLLREEFGATPEIMEKYSGKRDLIAEYEGNLTFVENSAYPGAPTEHYKKMISLLTAIA